MRTVILPETRLDQLVSYNKGCYIGQEVVARVKYRGHVNRALSGLSSMGTRCRFRARRSSATRRRSAGSRLLYGRSLLNGPSRSATSAVSTSPLERPSRCGMATPCPVRPGGRAALRQTFLKSFHPPRPAEMKGATAVTEHQAHEPARR